MEIPVPMEPGAEPCPRVGLIVNVLLGGKEASARTTLMTALNSPVFLEATAPI